MIYDCSDMDSNEQAGELELAEQLLKTLTLQRVDDTTFIGESFDYVGSRIFGGQVLGQALMAAAHTLPDAKPCHSLHGYFLRGGDIRYPVTYKVRILRDGRSLSARHITAVQYIPSTPNQSEGQMNEQVIFMMMASFSPMDGGLDYQAVMPSYPLPDSLVDEQAYKQSILDTVPAAIRTRFMRRRHILIKPVTPHNPLRPSLSEPKQAVWLCVPEFPNNSTALSQALLAFSSDFYLVSTGLLPHALSYGSAGLQLASIDHSMHFHRPFDITQWLLYDMKSDTTSHDKRLNHGQFWQNGQLIATTQQEGLMRLHPLELS